jgi:hypothetical protein
MNSTFACAEPIHNFLKQTTDQHLISAAVIACHERRDKSGSGHSAAISVFFNQHSCGAATCCRDCRTQPGRTAAYDEDICIVFNRNTPGIIARFQLFTPLKIFNFIL